LEIGLRDERVPVILEHASSCGPRLILAECPFVDDTWITGVIEQGRRDPRLGRAKMKKKASKDKTGTNFKQEPTT
jgi:hypothetical protein